MKKMMKDLFETGFYFVLCVFLTIYKPIKYIVVGENLLGRLLLVLGYAGLAITAFNRTRIFIFLIAIILMLELIVSIYMAKKGNSYGADGSSEDTNKTKRENASCKVSFFDGMTFEDAKKEYKKLMKQYHPDNACGDVEMSKKISAAYSQYKAVHGR